jgi:hypothetical protein
VARDPDLNDRGHIDPGNSDPINAWRPGSVAEQTKAKPDREGPDYANDIDAYVPTVHVVVNIPVRERTLNILRGPAAESLREFLRMQQQYQDTDQALGAQGQFSEIYHDTAKLKRMIWDRRNPQSVTVGEVEQTLMSLIGHALLAIDLIREGNKDGR